MMGKDSKISWTHHTFNPWWGCTKISAGCAQCYAQTLAARWGFGWGPTEVRTFGSRHWNEPRKWNRSAELAGTRARVFCGSMCDVFEKRDGYHGEALNAQRASLWKLIESTPLLDWLLLTKRPQNMSGMLPAGWLDSPRPNVWLGATVENNQAAHDRIPPLLKTPAALRFLSCEPLLEKVVLTAVGYAPSNRGYLDALTGETEMDGVAGKAHAAPRLPGLNWVIVGGESGAVARPYCVEWPASIIRQCRGAGVPVFHKQLGANCITRNDDNFTADEDDPEFPKWPDHLMVENRVEDVNPAQHYQGAPVRIRTRDRAGADPSEWRSDLRVRQMPEVRR